MGSCCIIETAAVEINTKMHNLREIQTTDIIPICVRKPYLIQLWYVVLSHDNNNGGDLDKDIEVHHGSIVAFAAFVSFKSGGSLPVQVVYDLINTNILRN